MNYGDEKDGKLRGLVAGGVVHALTFLEQRVVLRALWHRRAELSRQLTEIASVEPLDDAADHELRREIVALNSVRHVLLTASRPKTREPPALVSWRARAAQRIQACLKGKAPAELHLVPEPPELTVAAQPRAEVTWESETDRRLAQRNGHAVTDGKEQTDE